MLTGALFGLGIGLAVSALWAMGLFGYAFLTSLRPLGWVLFIGAIWLLLWNL